MAAPAIRAVDAAALDDALPLIAGYQRFYGVAEPDDGRNRAFWSRFLVPGGDRGVLLAAYDGTTPVGFATVYWSWESVAARDVAVLNAAAAIMVAGAADDLESGVAAATEAIDSGNAAALLDRLAERTRVLSG